MADLHVQKLVVTALARVCRDWSRVRSRDNPSAWVKRIAINLANSHYRRKKAEKRAASRLLGQRQEALAPDPQDVVTLRNAVLGLPRRERTAVILHFYLDMSFSQIASVMGIPLSTAKTLGSRGVARLRKESDIRDAKETDHARATQ